jgi:exosome complex exonuclease DIS3/RRP44
MPIREWVAAFGSADLMDVAAPSADIPEDAAGPAPAAGGGVLYDEHLAAPLIEAGLRDGTLFAGVLHVSGDNTGEARVTAVGMDRDILISGALAINRAGTVHIPLLRFGLMLCYCAVNGDRVAVRVAPQSEWRRPSVRLSEENADGAAPTDTADAAAAAAAAGDGPTDPDAQPQPTGKVVGIVRRNWRMYAGTLDASPQLQAAAASQSGASVSALFVPVDRRIPRVRISTRQAAQLLGQRVVVAIDSWDRTSRYPPVVSSPMLVSILSPRSLTLALRSRAAITCVR